VLYRVVKRGGDAGHNNAVYIFKCQSLSSKQIAKQHPVFVCRFRGFGRNPPACHKFFAFETAELYIRIADVSTKSIFISGIPEFGIFNIITYSYYFYN